MEEREWMLDPRIHIGFSHYEKQDAINTYCISHEIKKVLFFSPNEFSFEFETARNIPVRHIGYDDIIEYETFYPLLEEIDDSYLLVFNECMRTQNRNDLTYNCAHHYCNQTKHKLVFEYFPFIDSVEDSMILLNFIDKYKYKGKSFDYTFFREEPLNIRQVVFSLSTVESQASEKRYLDRKKYLFDHLGKSDPDTIPRQLHIFAGNFKSSVLNDSLVYVARNNRFNRQNVVTYEGVEPMKQYIVIDFPHRRIDFNDFLKKTLMRNIVFISSGLKVDKYYFSELENWVRRLEDFYAKASVS